MKNADSEENWESTWRVQKQNEKMEVQLCLVTAVPEDPDSCFQKSWLAAAACLLSLLYQEYRAFIIVTHSDYFLKFLTNGKT